MNTEIQDCIKRPTLDNLYEGHRMHELGSVGFVNTTFAASLFITSRKLPVNATPERVKLETARRVVQLTYGLAEQAWADAGFITHWLPEQLEAMAVELADKLGRSSAIAEWVLNELESERDKVFADRSLTHGDPLFVIHRCLLSDFDEDNIISFEEISIVEIKEKAIETIDRSLDYIKDLQQTNEYKKFINLRRILLCLKRVHDVVSPD